MNSRIFVFILAAIVLFFICFFTARIYIYGFRIANHPARNLVITALLLPVLYIGSLLDGRKTQRFGSFGHTLINVIAGIFFYLFLGAIVLGIISIGFLSTGNNVPLSLSFGILILSITAAIASLIQARRIVVTHYDVVLPNAPLSWNGKTAAMISDTHFGLINYKKFSDKIVNKILSLQPDFVLHAGDFYDGPTIDTAPITESWKKLTAQMPLFYTPGNHEAYGDYNVFVESVRAAGATVLDDKMVEHEGVQIAGTLYRSGKENIEIQNVLASILNTDPSTNSGRFAKPTILINHPPTAFDIPHQHGINLIVSGHTHQGQFWPFRYITHKIYGKYDYGMHSYKDMISITSDGIGTYGPPMRLFNSPEVVMITFKTT
jgi:predicted MPP superfamily phosphohydrolase